MTTQNERINNIMKQNPFMGASTAVAYVLREDILSCEIQPGARLKEIELSKEFDVSRTTVRRAFDFLIQEGLIIKKSNKGVVVKSLNSETSSKMNELRMMIEPRATAIAAKRRTMQDLNAIKAQLDALENSKTPTDFAKADLEFHTAIFFSTHNPYIVSASNLILTDIHRIKMYSSEKIFSEQFKRVLVEHTSIYKAILEMDAQAALNAAKKHSQIGLDPVILELSGL